MTFQRSVIGTGEYYHIFNRSVGEEIIFSSKKEIGRFLDLAYFYRYNQSIRYSHFNKLNFIQKQEYIQNIQKTKSIVEIYCYAIMPNHFHFLLKQLQENGIKTFVSNIQNGHAKYLNEKKHRHGSLFQSPYKSKWVGTTEEFLHLSRYIHLNPVTSYICKFRDLLVTNITSLNCYTEGKEDGFINTSPILELFDYKIDKYIEFVSSQIDYQRELNKIKHLTLE